MSVPSDRNVAAKTFEKLSKYKDLEIEVEKMWHFKTCTMELNGKAKAGNAVPD